MQRDEERAFHLAQFFVENHVKAEIIKAHATVFFIGKHRQKAVVPSGFPSFLANVFVLTPAFGMGGNFGRDPFANTVAKHIVLFFKNTSFDHGTSLVALMGLGIGGTNGLAIRPVRRAFFDKGFDALFTVIGFQHDVKFNRVACEGFGQPLDVFFKGVEHPL